MAVTFWSSRSIGRILWSFVLESVYTLVWVGVLLLLVQHVLGRRRLAGRSAWILGLAASVLYGAAWSYTGPRSAAFAFALVLPLVLGGLSTTPASDPAPGTGWRRVAPGWVVLPVALLSALGHLPTRVRYTAAFETDGLQGVRENPDRVRGLDETIAQIRRETKRRDPILALPDFPALYVLARRPNPTRVDWLIPQELTRAEAAQVLVDLDRRPPRLVVVSGGDLIQYRHRLLRPIVAYISQHYEKVRAVGEFEIYRRLGTAGAP
jgi:hypothetical protein